MWDAVLKAVDALKDRHADLVSAIRGIGLSGQMHGATLLDKDNKVIRPAILWNDVRSAAECAEMEEALPALRQIAGNIAMRALPRRKSSGSKSTSRRTTRKSPRCCCPRIMCGFF